MHCKVHSSAPSYRLSGAPLQCTELGNLNALQSSGVPSHRLSGAALHYTFYGPDGVHPLLLLNCSRKTGKYVSLLMLLTQFYLPTLLSLIRSDFRVGSGVQKNENLQGKKLLRVLQYVDAFQTCLSWIVKRFLQCAVCFIM